MGVVHKEVESVNHFAVVAHKWHFDSLFDNLNNGLLRLCLLLKQLNVHLFL
jgi:hypothetical protein